MDLNTWRGKIKKTLVVIANGSEARIYQAKSKNDFLLVHTFSHKESRQLGTELKSDRTGRGNDSFGAGRHAMEETTPPKEVEMQCCALEIANYLDDEPKHNRVERVYLSASPHFLGLLQKNLSSPLVARESQVTYLQISFKLRGDNVLYNDPANIFKKVAVEVNSNCRLYR